jgi:hypothetical protein
VRPAGRRTHRQAGKFETLTADGQHYEADQPWQQQWDRDAPQPQDGRTKREYCAEGLHQDGIITLTSP